LEALFKRDEFNKKYPRAAGYWEFSRPGYNTTHNEAIVYLANHCGGLCGTGNLVFLRKENGQWKVVRGRMLWIS
jgi:hypothetical protein